ncbi:MAG: AMP-binding protein [Solirubrobacteraceae bacterium]
MTPDPQSLPRPATVGELIARSDDHPALLVPGGLALNYAELHQTVAALAAQLRDAGVAPGDTVALSVGNAPHAVACFLAVLSMRAAAAPLNPAYTIPEARGYLDDLRPRALITEPGAEHGAVGACQERGVARLDVAPTERAVARFRLDGAGAGTETTATAAATGTRGSDRERSRPDDVALVLHTSGTTSRPKVVPLRQRNLAASIAGIIDCYALTPADVSHCVMPLFHVHGLVASTLATLASGGTVLVPPRFSAGAFWADCVAHGATWFSAVPTIHQVLSLRGDTEPIPPHGLRFARSCSAALSPTLAQRVERLLEVPLLQAYGMTEAAHQMASNPLPPGDRRDASVGRATGPQIAILDDDWRPQAPGVAGEVSISGPTVVDGYRDNPEANASAFRDGWFRTGDLGRLSDDGYLTLDGRIKELINRGGEKISPFEVEEALLTHPAVDEAVAYALPDEKYGEVVAAVVVAHGAAGERELSEHCAARLAPFKVPTVIADLDAIPKGPTGKVQRRLLAQLVKQ